jgi:hypothetical protein
MIDLPLPFLVGLTLAAVSVIATSLLLLNSIRKDAMRVPGAAPSSVFGSESTPVGAKLSLIAPSSLIERVFGISQGGV